MRWESYRPETFSKQSLTKRGMDEALSLGMKKLSCRDFFVTGLLLLRWESYRPETLSRQSLTKRGMDDAFSLGRGRSRRAGNPL